MAYLKWYKIICLVLLFSSTVLGQLRQDCNGTCESDAAAFLELYEVEASNLSRIAVEAVWNYEVDLQNDTLATAKDEANIELANFVYKSWNETIQFFDHETFVNETTKRLLKFLNYVGTAALDNVDLIRYNQILGEMSRVYGVGKICPFEKQDCDLDTEGLALDPDLEEIIAKNRSSEVLAYVWEAWRNASGRPIRESYKEYIALSNKAAVANGLGNTGDYWLLNYEDVDFRTKVGTVWEDVKELYDELYGYVRYRLMQVYPDDFNDPTDPIPAHLLGNMWSQTWESIYDLVKPYPGADGFDVTEAMKEQYGDNETGVMTMFETANKFFVDMGLEDMSMAYGDKGIISRIPNTEMICHASAWDFFDGQDFRIKMCTEVNQDDFIIVHHELGHIQYFINYKDQPITFREGANPGFHEAIGDVLSLSVATPKHMKKLGLIENGTLEGETTINYLMQKALSKVAFLPFGYLIDKYRWGLFDGSISEDFMQYEWMKIRNEIQGVIPPVKRSEADFDAGSKYHVPGNTPYIRYFVSYILQFQVYKELCIAAGQYNETNPEVDNPLYNCDFDGSTAAGDIMRTLLAKGFSENWQDVLEEAIGKRDMDGNAIKEYFAPLMKFLKEERQTNNYTNEWRVNAFEDMFEGQTPPTTPPTSTTTTTVASTTGGTGPSSPTSAPTTPESEKSDKLGAGLIIVGIIQGAGVAVVAAIYVVRTFILKKV